MVVGKNLHCVVALSVFALSSLVASAADSTSAPEPLKDGRVTYQQFLNSGDSLTGDPAMTAAIKRVAAATVQISKVYDENGISLWTDKVFLLGTGTVTGNRCYVLTSRHVLNKYVLGNMNQFDVDESVDPKGYRVEMRPALEVGGNRPGQDKLMGTVILTLGRTGSADTDVAVIRLDRRYAMPAVKMGVLDPSNRDTLDMANVGFPDDLQSNERADTLVVNPKFRGNAIDHALLTDLRTSSGASGGAIIAKDPVSGTYEFVGFAWSVSGSKNIPGFLGTTWAYGTTMGTSNANIVGAVRSAVLEDLKAHPCQP